MTANESGAQGAQDAQRLVEQSAPIKVGDRVIETTIRGDRREYEVVAVDQPPTNPAADPGPVRESAPRPGCIR